MRTFDADRVSDSGQKITRYIEKPCLYRSDAEELAEYGLAYLKQLHEGPDPRFAGCQLRAMASSRVMGICSRYSRSKSLPPRARSINQFVRSGGCLEQQFEMVGRPRFEPMLP